MPQHDILWFLCLFLSPVDHAGKSLTCTAAATTPLHVSGYHTPNQSWLDALWGTRKPEVSFEKFWWQDRRKQWAPLNKAFIRLWEETCGSVYGRVYQCSVLQLILQCHLDLPPSFSTLYFTAITLTPSASYRRTLKLLCKYTCTSKLNVLWQALTHPSTQTKEIQNQHQQAQ